MRKIYRWLAGGALAAAIVGNMLASVWAVNSIAQTTEGPMQAPTVRQTDAADVALLADIKAYINTPEYIARASAREARLREIELQLAAAHRQEAQEARYAESQREGVVLAAPESTPIFAFGVDDSKVTVACSTSEFGQVAVISTSAIPNKFFKAKYLRSCTAGQYTPGDEIGRTVGELAWSEHLQATGVAVEPSRGPVEMAMSGYRPGQYAAPTPESEVINLGAIAQEIKSIFSEEQ